MGEYSPGFGNHAKVGFSKSGPSEWRAAVLKSPTCDLAALIVALRLERIHLIGSSLGAEIALRLAVEHPELVRTQVVAEPGLVTWLVTLSGGGELFTEYANTLTPAKRAVQSGRWKLIIAVTFCSCSHELRNTSSGDFQSAGHRPYTPAHARRGR